MYENCEGMVSLLCETEKLTGFRGRMLQLGKQDIICTPAQINKAFASFGYPSSAFANG
jgi:hypothetical protein